MTLGDGSTLLNDDGEVVLDDDGAVDVCDDCCATCIDCGVCRFSPSSKIQFDWDIVDAAWIAACAPTHPSVYDPEFLSGSRELPLVSSNSTAFVWQLIVPSTAFPTRYLWWSVVYYCATQRWAYLHQSTSDLAGSDSVYVESFGYGGGSGAPGTCGGLTIASDAVQHASCGYSSLDPAAMTGTIEVIDNEDCPIVCQYCLGGDAAGTDATVTLSGISLQTCYEETLGNGNHLLYSGDVTGANVNQGGTAAISTCGTLVEIGATYTATITTKGASSDCSAGGGASVTGVGRLQISVAKTSLTTWLVRAVIGAANGTDVFYATYTVASGECGPVSFVVGNQNGAAAGYGGPWYGGTATVVIT